MLFYVRCYFIFNIVLAGWVLIGWDSFFKNTDTMKVLADDLGMNTLKVLTTIVIILGGMPLVAKSMFDWMMNIINSI